MAENTSIEWCDHTFNPWTGCTKVSPGCDHCYAEGWAKRSGTVTWGAGQPRRRTTPANWRLPVKWNAHAAVAAAGWAEGVKLYGSEAAALAAGNVKPRRPRVFCASLADVFDNAADPAWRVDLFRLIAATPHLDWLLLTKRIGNVAGMLGDYSTVPLLPNVWIGATIVNREEMLRDAGKLRAVNARVRFWSVEPLLGDLGVISRDLLPEWVICGGESGPGARPMHPDWARSLRDQCKAAGVPFLFKQWGEWAHAQPRPPETPGHFALAPREFAGPITPINYYPRMFTSFGSSVLERIGKKAAGRLLDGIEHNGFPT